MITTHTFLDLGGDVPAAADALHLHRTTLYYRLDRIKALTGVDLRTDPERHDLDLALRLAAFRKADKAERAAKATIA
ncbi:helix-turn-helix domain-containing protein [Streptomyces sp. S3(2020)]|uniref:helix-turn-helix domain-containing protein n=1 Tax=Streptomyces sp. S3(2020) TaxID=2732044 RepID=UPI001489FD91|nr:helix-turn-helix domain-containing protein [Streptomyces sp. S3(2020)]NNN29388.1 helix-turn-helix domain-containing protein [Streptomyces sp. S3(2020)]